MPNGGYCVNYPLKIFHHARGFENWEIFEDIPQFWLGNIRSREAFRPIARGRKYLMDYRLGHLSADTICSGKL